MVTELYCCGYCSHEFDRDDIDGQKKFICPNCGEWMHKRENYEGGGV